MSHKLNLKKFSFLVYGLGASGISVIKYFKKKNFINYFTWDDNPKFKKKFKSKNTSNINKTFKEVDYIVLSPGISIKNSNIKKSY